MKSLLQQLLDHMTTIENLLQQIQNGQISADDLQDLLTLMFQQYFTDGSGNNIFEYLEQIISSLGNIEGLQSSIRDLLIQQLNQFDGIRDDLRTLVNTVRQGNQTLQEQNEMLLMIYETLNAFKNQTNAQLGDIAGYLQSLIGLVKNGNMTLDELKGLIAAIKQDTSAQKDVSLQILEILKNIDTGNKQNSESIKDITRFLNQILTAINNQTSNDNNNTQAILDALSNGLTISGGQIDMTSLHNMLTELISLVQSGNTTLAAILNQILAADGNSSQYDDSQILALLRAILAAINACCDCGNGDTNEGVIIDGNVFSVGAQPTNGNTFAKNGDGLIKAIKYILHNADSLLGVQSNLSHIEEVKDNAPKTLKPGMAATVTSAARQDLKDIFSYYGLRDNQAYIIRMTSEKQAQVLDIQGRTRGVINDAEVLKKVFKIQ